MVKALMIAGAALCLATLPAKAQDKAQDRTIAIVNGIPVKQSRVNEQLDQIPNDLLKGREGDVRSQLLDRVIDQELVAQEAKRLNVQNDPEYKKQLMLVTLQLQANAVVARKVTEALTPAVLRRRYEEVKANLGFPAVKAKHILVGTEQEAIGVIKIANPANFSSLAKTISKGPSAEQGGDLGWFRKEAMIPEFAEVAFSHPVGKVVQSPVKTDFGWHVLLLEERNDNFIPPFEQVEPQLREELSKGVIEGYLGNLRKNATITYPDKPAEAKR